VATIRPGRNLWHLPNPLEKDILTVVHVSFELE
jgi:hypothetical protein